MLSLSIRPARRSDCEAVQKLINSQQDVLQKRFAQTNASSLLESSIINIVAIDDSDKVVGFAALNDCPPLLNHLAVLGPQRWEPWLAERFEQHTASAANSLWLNFFVSHAMFEAEVSDMVLRFVYTSPMCSHVDSILAVLPVTAIAYCPLHERFNALPTRPERASPTGSGAASSLAVYTCNRSQVVPIVKVRRARVEDHDDLVPLFERQTQVLTQQYGQFFLVDLIGKQDSLNCALVAECNGRAVGLMVATADADTAVLKQSFDLAAFNNLDRDGEDCEPGSNAFCVTMFCMDERFEAQSGRLLALAFEQFPGREYCLLTMPHACAETHLVSAYFSLVPSLPTNSFTHVLYLLHRESLEASSRVSSCASVLPAISSLSADTIRAVRAGPEDLPRIQDLLVGMEGRAALLAEVSKGALGQASAEEDEMQTWLFTVRGHVIGTAVVKNEIRTKEMSAIQKQFHLEDVVDAAAIPLFAQTELRLFALHPVFLAHSRSLLQTLLRVNGKTLMFHRASSSLSTTAALPVQPLLLKEMVQVKPRVDAVSRHVVSVGLQALHAAGSSLTENRSLFSLFVLGKAHLPYRKQVNNCRITVVGASDTGLSFLSGLLSRPAHYFSNVTLISRGGWDKIRELEGMRKQETLPRVSLSNSLCFEEGELERLGLEHRVRILDATVTGFDSEAKTIDLSVALPPRPSSVAASAARSQSNLETSRSAASQPQEPAPPAAQPTIPESTPEATGPAAEADASQPKSEEPVFTIAIQQPDAPADPAGPAPAEPEPAEPPTDAPAAESGPETNRTAVTVASTVGGQVGEPRGEVFVKLSLAYDYLVLTPGLQDRALLECGFKPLSNTAASIVNPSEPAVSNSSSHQSLPSVLRHSHSVQEDLMGQNALDGGHEDEPEEESPLPKYRKLDGVYSLREDIVRLTEYLAYVREVRYYTTRSSTTAALPTMGSLPSDRRGTNTSQVSASFDGALPSPADLSARALFPRVIVYGASMDVVCAIESLIREGIPAKSITWAVPPRDRAIANADSPSSSAEPFPSADPRAPASPERQFSIISAANTIEELARVAENMTGQTVVVSKEAARRNSAVFKQGLHAYELTASASADSGPQSAQLAAVLENLDWCYGYEMVFQRTVAHLLKLGVTRLPNATLHSVEYDLPAPSSLPTELLRHAKRPVVKFVNLDVQIASGKGLGPAAAALSPTESPVSSPIMVDTQRIPCDLLLTADRCGLDNHLFHALTRNELVFDGRLVVDAGFHTVQSSAAGAPRPAYPSASPVEPEPAIVYAAGSAAKFSRRRELFESEGAMDPRALAVRGADMVDLNSRAVGEALCMSVLRDLGIHTEMSSPLALVARQCKTQLGSLPGGGFLELSLPTAWRGLPSQVVSSDTNGLFCQLIFDQRGSLSSLIVHGPAARLPSNPRQLGNIIGLPMTYFHPLLTAMQDPRPQGVDLIAYLQSDSVRPLLSGEFGSFRGQLQSLLRSNLEEARPLNTAEYCDAIPFSIAPADARGSSGLDAVTPVLRALLAKTKDIDSSAVSAAIQTLAKHLGPATAKPAALTERFAAQVRQDQQ